MQPPSLTRTDQADKQMRHRIDIQAFRGFAVLVVVLYHARLNIISAGYLGVDIFFCISGFVITTMVAERIKSGNFSFADFYWSRARRLLPAAYVTFLAVALLAPLFLTSPELQQFKSQMFGALTFTANIALAKQVGYFDGAAELKPLLHTWSLAIEEQYYLLLPISLVLLPRRLWFGMLLIAIAASAITCFFVYRNDSSSAFYLIQSRGWELGLGSIAALVVNSRLNGRIVQFLFWPALCVVVVLPFTAIKSLQPGLETAAVCAGTVALILRNHPVLNAGPVMRAFAWVGDRSYAFYLIHWPALAFFNNLWIGKRPGDQPAWLLLGLVALSLLLAALVTRCIENPIRRGARQKPATGLIASILVATGALATLTAGAANNSSSTRDFSYVRRINYGFDSACEFKESFQAIPQCRNGEQPEIMVWGDSFAMHLVPGLVGDKQHAPSVIQATRSFCGPILGVAAQSEKFGISQKWGESCIAFNDSVVDYLAKTDSIRIVVLSSPLTQYLDKEEKLLKRDSPGHYSYASTGMQEAISGLRQTALTLRRLGKQVVIVAPPPASGFDIGRCLELSENKLTPLGAAVDCQVDKAAYQAEKKPVLELLAALPNEANINVVDFDAYLCGPQFCRTHEQGILIYRDIGHLSHEGSVHLAQATSLVDRIRRAAK